MNPRAGHSRCNIVNRYISPRGPRAGGSGIKASPGVFRCSIANTRPSPRESYFERGKSSGATTRPPTSGSRGPQSTPLRAGPLFLSRLDATRRADLEVVKLNLCQFPPSSLRERSCIPILRRAFIVTVRRYTELT